MKKLFFIIVTLAAVTMMGAQELRFAVKGGLNVGTLSLDVYGEEEKTDGLTSFYVGGRLEYGLAEKISIQGELIYQTFGGVYKESDDTYLYKSDIKIQELSVPIVFKYYIVPQRFSLNAGVSFGLVLKGTEKWSIEDTYFDESDGGEEDIEDLSTLNFGISFGAEFLITDDFFIDARYNIGLSNLYNGEDADEIIFSGNVLQVGVGYRF